MSKERAVEAQNWHAESHATIHDTAQKFNPGKPHDAAEPFTNNGSDLTAEGTIAGRLVQGVLGTSWRGVAATTMQQASSKLFKAMDDYATKMQAFGEKLPDLARPIELAKAIPAPLDQAAQHNLSQEYLHRFPGASQAEADGQVAQLVNKQQNDAREAMTGQFSNPVVGTGHSASMDDADPSNPGTNPYQQTSHDQNTGSNNSSNATGSHSGQGQDGQTKPAFTDGSGSQNGQGQGQGQGQGGGSGSGSGGSGGGSPSGAGSGSSPFGSGADARNAGYSPYSPTYTPGHTTSAGFTPGTATGTGAPGALRPGAGGIPGPGAGSGVNPAGVGASGVRGGAGGLGGFGMGGLGGAHARGQREEDEDHEIPSILINADNGNELYGDLPKASPGVIGDWTEQERAEKQRREAEKRRYKSLGWEVDFGDDK